MKVGVAVAVLVFVMVCVKVKVNVGVNVEVFTGVTVTVLVLVRVPVKVLVGVGELVKVLVTVKVCEAGGEAFGEQFGVGADRLSVRRRRFEADDLGLLKRVGEFDVKFFKRGRRGRSPLVSGKDSRIYG